MKTILLITVAILFSSCGYSIKSDRELSQYKYQVTNIEQEMEELRQKTTTAINLIEVSRIRDSLSMVRYKDSIQFMKLKKVVCWEKGTHRHDCEIYK